MGDFEGIHRKNHIRSMCEITGFFSLTEEIYVRCSILQSFDSLLGRHIYIWFPCSLFNILFYGSNNFKVWYVEAFNTKQLNKSKRAFCSILIALRHHLFQCREEVVYISLFLYKFHYSFRVYLWFNYVFVEFVYRSH